MPGVADTGMEAGRMKDDGNWLGQEPPELEIADALQFPCTIEDLKWKKAKVVGMRVESTREFSPAEFAILTQIQYTEGMLLYRRNSRKSFTEKEVPKTDTAAGGKTSSQRQRAVMFVYWQTKTDQSEQFDSWYESAMTRNIEWWKARLD